MNRAFSLVELSIVLVILGLLTGGILTGQNLIRAAELRSITTQVDAYRTATYTFRDKYFALPGDMTNAHRFWAATSSCIDDFVGTDPTGCNGNGDGFISHYNREGFRAWQHLANAGLIEGTYTGLQGSAGILDANINENVPPSKISNAGFIFDNLTTTSNSIMLGSDPGGDNPLWGAALKVEELWSIDQKVDDGLADSGIVKAMNGRDATPAWLTGCVDADYPAARNYIMNSTTVSCHATFKLETRGN